MKPFVHLHNHTAFSLLDGAGRIEDEVNRAAELGMPALAITDHGVMYGAVQFYNACKKAGIRPIIGCEVYVARRTRFDREPGRDDAPYHLILLVENETGYHNLCRLVSLASLEGFYYRPRVDKELLAAHHEGLIALSACLAGELPRLIMANRMDDAREAAIWHRDVFGKDNYFLELQNHGIPEQQIVNDGLLTLSRELNIPTVATNDNHYVSRGDAAVQDVMLCIQTGKTFNEPDRMRFDNDEFYLKSYDEMAEALPGQSEALDNTVKIAERCRFDFQFGVHYMPTFEPPNGESQASYLNQLCLQGLKKRYGTPGERALSRLDKELSTIHQMGYDAYFLIVWDFIDYARRNGIYVGPGRGSAAGSIVSYALGITDIDPLKYDLLFERFLNPERVNMPDIDIDFCYERRDEVIEYVSNKYGADHVSQIITFGTMAARGAVRDVGRVMEVPLSVVNKVCKLIPNELGITLEKAINASPELRTMMAEDESVDHLIHTAQKLEGLPRHAGTHAAGVVISQKPLDRYLPLQRTSEDVVITQFAKDDVEAIGLLKMDFLGLRTLTVINHTIENIKARHGIDIDFQSIDEDDPETFEMLSRGDSLGVFQLEGGGLRAVLKELKPTCLEDVIALVALYRPGPLGSGMVEDFIARKHGEKDIEYLHPLLEPILKTTYGVILYQEQVMQIASRLAGFSLGEADMLRRAMGKKKPEIIEGFRNQFLEGAYEHGVDQESAAHIFSLIEYFAGYGFNKSHSAAYGVLAFQTAWLKCHYPKEFMAELLNSVMDNAEKVTFYVKECDALGIPVLPPNVNESGYGFTVTEHGIRFGLGAIKGVGDAPVAAICEARHEDGAFKGLQDFCLRVDLHKVNKRVLENLIRCGAFDFCRHGKRALLAAMEECVAQAMALQKSKNSNQLSFFDMMGDDIRDQATPIDIPEMEDYSKSEHLKMERELLGIYVSGHPLDDVRDLMARLHLLPLAEIDEAKDGKVVTVGGILTDIRFQTTKKGDLMAYAKLEDLSGSIDLLIFPRTLPQLRMFLEEDAMIQVRGRISSAEEDAKIFVESMEELDEKKLAFNGRRQQSGLAEKADSTAAKLYLQLSPSVDRETVLNLLATFPGSVPVYFFDPVTRRGMILNDSYWIKDDPVAISAVEALIGSDNVSFKRQ